MGFYFKFLCFLLVFFCVLDVCYTTFVPYFGSRMSLIGDDFLLRETNWDGVFHLEKIKELAGLPHVRERFGAAYQNWDERYFSNYPNQFHTMAALMVVAFDFSPLFSLTFCSLCIELLIAFFACITSYFLSRRLLLSCLVFCFVLVGLHGYVVAGSMVSRAFILLVMISSVFFVLVGKRFLGVFLLCQGFFTHNYAFFPLLFLGFCLFYFRSCRFGFVFYCVFFFFVGVFFGGVGFYGFSEAYLFNLVLLPVVLVFLFDFFVRKVYK